MTHDDSLDDLASAHLDGVTTPEEAAQIASDPALQDRVAAMRAIREAVRADVPVDAARRDAGIGAALAAYDESVASVTSLAEVAARRTRTTGLRWLGAAAVVLLLLALAPLVGRLGSGDDDQMASTGDASARDEDAGSAAEAGGADASTTVPSAQTYPLALGTYPSIDALVDGLRRPDIAEQLFSDAPQEATPDLATGCEESPTGGVVVASATAVVGDREVVVLLVERDGARHVVVLDPGRGCDLVADEAL